uniref:ARAD1D11396p n=1 Tax=Blastobotrys adeninivorans TaxID=409370 RepID=A0A060T9F1_BLAAD
MSVTLTQRRPSMTAPKEESKKAVDTFGDEFVVPSYSIKDILDAIPAHCYKRSTVRSLSYVARDVFFIGLFGYLAASYIHLIPWMSGRVVAWFLYAFVQGLFGTGCWVLAHECGHRAFSESNAVNDSVGWLLHSALLVPYHSWRLSHSKHHKATGHLTRDMVFVPKTRDEFLERRGIEPGTKITDNLEDAPIVTLYYVVLQQLFGWIMYLFTNVTGQKYPNRSKWVTNHFVPTSPLYDKKDFINIVISDIGIIANLTCLYLASQKWGFSTVALMYIFPYLWVNHWLVHITFLQHTDPRLPHYDADEWTFAKGASATIDRDFGFIGRHIFHDIIETHVLHHFVSRIPFYNGREATEAIKKVMGTHYKRDDSNFVTSLYRVARTCQFVEGDNGVSMFRNVNNIGVRPNLDQGQKLQ